MDRVNILPNQRVGISDYEAGSGGQLVQADQLREGRVFLLPSGRATGSAATQARILGGFDFDSFTAGVDDTLTMNRGRGIFPLIDDDDQLTFGLIKGDEGPSEIIIDFSGAPAASTQTVYVRAVNTLGTFQNRVFWNPSGAPAREFIDNVATRKVSSWEVTFQDVAASAPGNGEYVKVWEVVMDGSSKVSSVTDYRHFYFEGDAKAATAYDTEWGGGANDRNTDRATYGIQDNHLWVQAVRRQLADVIGDPWYTAPKTSIKGLFPLLGRYTTIDKPGGPGGDGTYADIPTAITALNAADGGTILLQEGTYVISASQTITKQINFIGVEGGAIIENQINSAVYLLDFQAGSEGSAVQNIKFSEHATLSSEHAISFNANDCILERCNLEGALEIEAANEILVKDCQISAGIEDDFADFAIKVTGAGCNASFIRCSIVGQNNTRNDTVIITTVSDDVIGTRSQISFTDCRFNTNLNPRTIYASSTDFDLHIRSCNFLLAPPQATLPALLLNAGRVHIVDSTFEIDVTGDDWDAEIISTSGLTGEEEMLKMSGCSFDGAALALNATGVDVHAFNFSGFNDTIDSCQFFNIKFIDSSITVGAGNCWMLLNPAVGGHLILQNSKFWRITNSGVNDIDMQIVGQPLGITGPGAGNIHVMNCIFDGTDHVYRSGSGSCGMLSLQGPTVNYHVANNLFFGGVWDVVVDIRQGGLNFHDNQFLFSDAPAPGVRQIFVLQGNQAQDRQGFVACHHNHVFRNDVSNPTIDSPIFIRQFNRASVVGNTDISLGATAPTNGSMYLDLIDNLIIYANTCEQGITSGTIGFLRPPTISTDNQIV